jgi:hypothetical protein
VFQFKSGSCDKRLSESDGDDEGYIKCIETLSFLTGHACSSASR